MRDNYQCTDHPNWKKAQQLKAATVAEQVEHRKTRYNLNSKRCKECSEPLPYNKRHNQFCNRSCSTSFNNKQGGSSPQCKLAGCSNLAKRSSSGGILQFCSDACYKTHIDLLFIKRFELSEKSLIDNRPLQRKFLLQTRGAKCECCKNTEWMKQPIPLQVDHIDGNASNNIRTNLRLICPNCHALEPTYAGRNRGKGRKTLSQANGLPYPIHYDG